MELPECTRRANPAFHPGAVYLKILCSLTILFGEPCLYFGYICARSRNLIMRYQLLVMAVLGISMAQAQAPPESKIGAGTGHLCCRSEDSSNGQASHS